MDALVILFVFGFLAGFLCCFFLTRRIVGYLVYTLVKHAVNDKKKDKEDDDDEDNNDPYWWKKGRPRPY
jgi:hypothetical protein